MKKLVKLEKPKDIFIDTEIKDFKDPQFIYLPCECNYKEGEYLYKNTFINDIVTSISGYVVKTEKLKCQNSITKCYKIANDYKENIKEKIQKKKCKNKDDLINYLEKFNLNNIITKISNKESIQNIVFSCIDEETYSFSEFMTLSNYFNEILETLNYLLNVFSLSKGIIATKNTFSSSIKNVKSILGTYPNILLRLIPDLYLISYEENLCDYLNILSKDTLILNGQEILDLYYALIKGKINNSVLLTISGNNVLKTMIVMTRTNTLAKEVIDKYIELKSNDYDIYINGLLRGYKENNECLITKDIHTIIINEKETTIEEECINCGACQEICPFHINVLKCYLEKRSSKKCFNCGLCNYICPANIKLKEVVGMVNNEKKKH